MVMNYEQAIKSATGNSLEYIRNTPLCRLQREADKKRSNKDYKCINQTKLEILYSPGNSSLCSSIDKMISNIGPESLEFKAINFVIKKFPRQLGTVDKIYVIDGIIPSKYTVD